MPNYNYTAKDSMGRVVKGAIVLDNKMQAYNSLIQKKLKVTEINEEGKGLNKEIKLDEMFVKKVKIKDIAIFCRQFATVLRAGVPVLKTLDILRLQTESKAFRPVLDKVFEDLQKGSMLSETLRQHKTVFPSILINMVEAGELSGTLDNSFEKMAVHFEKEFKLKQKVKSAATYPMVISIIAILAVVILLTFVVPQFSSMFDSFGAKLPATTQALLNAGTFMKSNWYYVLIGIFGTFTGVAYYKKTPTGRAFFDRLFLKLPIIKEVQRKTVSARLTRTMATILSAGVPLIAALDVAEKVVDNTVAEDAIRKVKEDVMKGGGLAKPLSKFNIFPTMVSQMISIGEESGAVDKMMEKTADFYEEEVDGAITQIITLMEPGILIFMAVVIGFIVISIIQPMFSIYGNIK